MSYNFSIPLDWLTLMHLSKVEIPFVHEGNQLCVKFLPWGLLENLPSQKKGAGMYIGFTEGTILTEEFQLNLVLKMHDPIEKTYITRNCNKTLGPKLIDWGFPQLFSTEEGSPYLQMDRIEFQIIL